MLQAWDLRSQWKSLRMRAAACLGPTEGLEGVRVPDTNTKNQALCTDTHRPDFRVPNRLFFVRFGNVFQGNES